MENDFEANKIKENWTEPIIRGKFNIAKNIVTGAMRIQKKTYSVAKKRIYYTRPFYFTLNEIRDFVRIMVLIEKFRKDFPKVKKEYLKELKKAEEENQVEHGVPVESGTKEE